VIGSGEDGFRSTLRNAALLILAASVFGRFLGLARDLAVAYYFGAGADTDAFFLANRLPTLVSVSIAGALTASLIPVFTQRYVVGKREEAWRLTVSMFNVTGLALLAFAAVCVVAAPWLVPLIGPGFDASTTERAVHLFRILMPLIVFAGLSGLATGVLNSMRKFGLPAVSTSLGTLVTLFVLLGSARAWGLTGLAIATTVGAATCFLVLVPQLLKSGLPYRPRIAWEDPGLRQVGGMIWPILLGSAVGAASTFADQVLGSFLEPGSISALSFSEKLFHLPLGLLVAAVAVPLFPLLSEHVARDEPELLKTHLGFSLRIIAFMLIPASLGLIVLRAPVVALLFEHGEFTAEDTARTAWALLFYSMGLFSYAGRDILTRVFYAYHDTRTPIGISVGAVVLNVGASIVLMQFLGVGGLALGTTIAFTANFGVLFYLLRRKIGPLGIVVLMRSFARIVVAAAVMSGAVWAIDRGLDGAVPSSNLGLAVRVAVAVAGGVVVYAAAAALGRLPEISELKGMLTSMRKGRGALPAGPVE